MKRIACRDSCAFFVSLSLSLSSHFNNGTAYLIYLPFVPHTNKHTNAFHLAHKQYQMLKAGGKSIPLSTKTQWLWIDVTQKANFHVKSSAFRYVLIWKEKKKEENDSEMVTMTFAIFQYFNIFNCFVHASNCPIQCSIVRDGVQFFSIWGKVKCAWEGESGYWIESL